MVADMDNVDDVYSGHNVQLKHNGCNVHIELNVNYLYTEYLVYISLLLTLILLLPKEVYNLGQKKERDRLQIR